MTWNDYVLRPQRSAPGSIPCWKIWTGMFLCHLGQKGGGEGLGQIKWTMSEIVRVIVWKWQLVYRNSIGQPARIGRKNWRPSMARLRFSHYIYIETVKFELCKVPNPAHPLEEPRFRVCDCMVCGRLGRLLGRDEPCVAKPFVSNGRWWKDVEGI